MENNDIASLRRRSQGVVSRAVGEGMLLLDMEAGQIHQLNGTASLIWRNCDESQSIAQIAQLLVDRFDVEWGVAMEDVSATLCKLRSLNLVQDA